MIRSLFALALTVVFASPALAMDPAYFQIKKVTVSDVTAQFASNVMAQPGLVENCNSSQRPFKTRLSSDVVAAVEADLNPLNAVELIVDQIINIGKKIFAVVKSGQAVVNINIDTANALPRGLTCWSDLAGWNIPQSKVYNVQYENGFGMVVVDYSYRVTFTAGGNANGIGQYITNATFQPANLSVAWGFNFDANALIPSVINNGTARDPIAGMQMNMDWKVTSPVSHELGGESYFVLGSNKLMQLK